MNDYWKPGYHKNFVKGIYKDIEFPFASIESKDNVCRIGFKYESGYFNCRLEVVEMLEDKTVVWLEDA